MLCAAQVNFMWKNSSFYFWSLATVHGVCVTHARVCTVACAVVRGQHRGIGSLFPFLALHMGASGQIQLSGVWSKPTADPAWLFDIYKWFYYKLIFIFFYFLKTGFPCSPVMSWNFLCKAGWPQTHVNPSASPPRMLGLYACATMPG